MHSLTGAYELVQKKINWNTATIGIIGLGYVGLPLAIQIANKNFKVIGFEKDKNKLKAIENEVCYVQDVNAEHFFTTIRSKYFFATDDFNLLQITDIIIICVPTPTDKEGNPDLTYVLEAITAIAGHASKNCLVILESTTYPGTTQEVLLPILENANFKVGESCFIAFSPERIDPGNPKYKTVNTPRIVGGVTQKCTKLAISFYKQVIESEVYSVSSPAVAEMEKLLENTFRNVNIALVNELTKLCHKLNINIWEVIEAAATKPYGYMAFYPGPGVGGHCIPIDPKYLEWKAKQVSVDVPLIHCANEINKRMPQYIVDRLNHYLQDGQQGLHPPHITVIGLAYKKNIDDYRESPALSILKDFNNLHYHWSVVDPNILTFNFSDQTFDTVPLTEQLISSSDCILILANHDNIDYQMIDMHAKCIFDTRNTDYPFKNARYYRL